MREYDMSDYPDYEAEARELRITSAKLMRLLLDLTPGGSEFAGDPEACAAWLRARLASTGKLAAERNKLREQAEQMAKLLAEAQTAINLLDDDWIRQHPELGCPDPDELLEKIGRVLRDGRPSNA
jgi:hypothetical protein